MPWPVTIRCLYAEKVREHVPHCFGLKLAPAVPFFGGECLKGHYSAEKLFWFIETGHSIDLPESWAL